MAKTYPKKLGNVSHDDIVYYLEDKIGEAVNDVFPEFPDADGDYMLILTMDDGTATLSWEALES